MASYMYIQLAPQLKVSATAHAIVNLNAHKKKEDAPETLSETSLDGTGLILQGLSGMIGAPAT